MSSLLLIVAILLGIILRSSLGNRLDKSILLVLLGEEKLLLTEFVITVEIVVSSEVEIIQLGFELFKARIPYNLGTDENTDPSSAAPEGISAGNSTG